MEKPELKILANPKQGSRRNRKGTGNSGREKNRRVTDCPQEVWISRNQKMFPQIEPFGFICVNYVFSSVTQSCSNYLYP